MKTNLSSKKCNCVNCQMIEFISELLETDDPQRCAEWLDKTMASVSLLTDQYDHDNPKIHTDGTGTELRTMLVHIMQSYATIAKYSALLIENLDRRKAAGLDVLPPIA